MELGRPERLDYLEEDQQGYREVWTELQKIWTSCIQVINETPFSAYVFKKVKDLLETTINAMGGIKDRIRQYDEFTHYKNMLQNYKKLNGTLGELKSDAMKDRHWKDLLKRLHIKASFNELAISHFWAADLVKNPKVV